MKSHWFHLMPYKYLPEDFQQKYKSVWVGVPSELYDPVKGHELYQRMGRRFSRSFMGRN